jgi:drug/metabolite transporter (DMT)-like permease
MAVLLALLSSAMWGTSDFLGGNLSRRKSPFVVVGWAQVAGLAFVLIACLVGNRWDAWPIIGWTGVIAGVTGYIGLVTFYTALSRGTMGVVAPITSLGVIVPVAVGLGQGDQPTVVQEIGIVVALIGIVLASGPEIRGGTGLLPVMLALAAALSFGIAVTYIAKGSQVDAFATLGIMRVVALVISGALLVATIVKYRLRVDPDAPSVRSIVLLDRRAVITVIAIGFFDVGANVMFGVSSTLGLLSIVAVAGSLYPVATVILAGTVLKERLATIEKVGVALALFGVGLIALG